MLQCRKLQANVEAKEEGRTATFQAPEGFTSDAGPTVYGIAFIAYSVSMSSQMLREVRPPTHCVGAQPHAVSGTHGCAVLAGEAA